MGQSQAGVAGSRSATDRTLRLLSMNAFLIPAVVAGRESSCTRQQERAAGIGRLIATREVDVACLQEMWGAGMAAVEAGLAQRYAVLPSCGSWGVELVDVVMQYLNRRGGLWQAFLHDRNNCDHNVAGTQLPRVVSLEATRWRTFPFSNTRSKKGLHAARYALNPYVFKANFLIVVNTHLDPSNANDAIVRQTDILAGFVSELLRCKVFMSGCDDLNDCALLIVGDFNVHADGAASPLRKAVYNTLGVGCPSSSRRSARDLYRSVSAAPPYTYDIKSNSLVEWNEQGRLDWQLAVDSWDGEPLARVTCKQCEAVTQPRGEELSDHWGVVLDLAM